LGDASEQKQPVVPAERRRMIIDLLREQGSVSVAAVEERFGVSSMTARRDLALLDEKGYARRTHGGAILPELAGHEDSFQSRLEYGVETKLRIAHVVARTVTPQETVFVDSSSSSYYVVRELLDLGTACTLLTNSLPLMTLVGAGDHPQVELIGIGGTFRLLNRSFVGSSAIRTIERYFADRIVFSVKGIEPGGYLTDPDPFEAEVKRAMIDRSRSVVLIAQGYKFDERGLNVVVPLTKVDQAYLTDAPATGGQALQEAGVDVISV
jgi:DeoR/GlpR family transcriptional regulator of sugar metabolism